MYAVAPRALPASAPLLGKLETTLLQGKEREKKDRKIVKRDSQLNFYQSNDRQTDSKKEIGIERYKQKITFYHIIIRFNLMLEIG